MRSANCIVIASALSLAALAPAQENIFRALPGAKQLGIMGSFLSGNGTSAYSVTVEGGYYLTDRLVAIGRVGVEKHSPENWLFLAGVRYDFKPQGRSIPYLVVAAEFHRGSRPMQTQIVANPFDPNATFLQGGVGMDFFLSPTTATFLEFVAFKKSGDNRIGTNLEIGLRVFFK